MLKNINVPLACSSTNFLATLIGFLISVIAPTAPKRRLDPSIRPASISSVPDSVRLEPYLFLKKNKEKQKIESKTFDTYNLYSEKLNTYPLKNQILEANILYNWIDVTDSLPYLQRHI